MNDIANDRIGPMLNPPHLGELIRESMDDVGLERDRDGGRGSAASAERCRGC